MSKDNSGRRYLCLWLPFLSADRWRHEHGQRADDDAPLVFIEKVRGVSCVAACDAQALHLQVGVSLAEAWARHSALKVMPFDSALDRAFLLRLAERAAAFTPTVALDEPNGLALDITGCAHLRGGEIELVRKFEKVLQSVGATMCRIAVAPTPDMARALARFARQTPCFADDDSQVCGLPVAALESNSPDTIALKRAGLKTIGDVANRPSVLFAERFSPTFTTTLARVLGQEDRRITPLKPPPIFIAEYRCAEPIISLDVVEAVLARLVVNVSEQLRIREEGGRLFKSVFVRTDGVIQRLCCETSAPTRDPAVITRLYQDRLETLADQLDCGFGLDLIRFEVLRSEPCAASQIALDARQEQKEHIGQLVDRLGAMFGRERVIRLRPENTHIPEQSQVMIPAADDTTPACELSHMMAIESCARPFLLFKNPQPIEIESDHDDEPRGFRWRRIHHKIACIDGPERIADEWWHTPSCFGTRDYYRTESAEGRWFWIFRAWATNPATQPRWFLHGIFP